MCIDGVDYSLSNLGSAILPSMCLALDKTEKCDRLSIWDFDNGWPGHCFSQRSSHMPCTHSSASFKQEATEAMTPPFTCPVTHLQLVPLETILICSILCLFCLLQKNCNMPIITWMRLRGNLGSRHVTPCQVCHPRDLLHPTPKAIPQCPATALGTAISIGRTFVVLHNSTK